MQPIHNESNPNQMALISFIILFSYTAYYLSRVGLLPSHSDSYLALGKQGLWWNEIVEVREN